MKPFLEKITKETEHTFVWHPVSEIPALDTPILFLTNRGAIVTHKSSKHFRSNACYANAVAWCYQTNLIPNIDKTE